MKFEKVDSRRLRVTDLPETVDGIRTKVYGLEVLLAYTGDGSVYKGIVLDNVVVPLMLAAPALLLHCKQLLDWTKPEYQSGVNEDYLGPIWRAADAAIAQATGEEVNA